MRENRPSGSEGGVAFGPSLPLSEKVGYAPAQRSIINWTGDRDGFTIALTIG